MNLEITIRNLLNRLVFLGYGRFQIRNMVQEAIGKQPWLKEDVRQNARVLSILEKYEKLGSDYLFTYSK